MTGFRTRIINRLYQQHNLDGLAVQLSSEDLLSRLESASALQKLGDPRGFDYLVSCLSDNDPLVRGSAVELLAGSSNSFNSDVVIPLLSDPDIGVRQAAADTLALLTGEPVTPYAPLDPAQLDKLRWLDKTFIIDGILFTIASASLIVIGKLSALEFLFVWCCLIAAGCFLGCWGLQRGGRLGYVAVFAGCLSLVLGIPVLTAPGILAIKYITRQEVRLAFQEGPAR